MALDLPDVAESSYREMKEKQDRKGILYIARVPPGMTPKFVKGYFGEYGIERVYFAPEDEERRKRRKKSGGSGKRRYTEGWLEFEDKRCAKKVAACFSGQPVGGKKRHNPFHDDLWALKYLSGFKWENLTERFLYERKMREHRLKAELAQSKKEVDFIVDKMEWSKRLQNIKEKAKNKADEPDSSRNNEESKNEIEERKEKSVEEQTEKLEEKIAKAASTKLLKKRLKPFKQRMPIKAKKEIIEDS